MHQQTRRQHRLVSLDFDGKMVRQPPQTKKWKVMKCAIYAVSLIICIFGIGFTFSLLRKRSSFHGYSLDELNFYYNPAVEVAPVVGDAYPTANLKTANHIFQFIIAFICNGAEILMPCFRKCTIGIHPGILVGVSLCLWMTSLILGTLFVLQIPPGRDPHDYGGECNNGKPNEIINTDVDCSQRRWPIEFVAVAALTVLLSSAEFLIFVTACVDTHARRKWKE